MTFKKRERRTWIVQPLLLLLIIFPVGIFTGAAMQVDFLFW
jgi:hypothetical protein